MKITICILTYNSAETIRQCLESLIRQTDKEFFVHIVDDNSKDDTLSIIKQFTDRLDIRTFTNGTNIIPRGRNIALESVKSGICAFIDSDDTAEETWVETIRATFNKHPDLALISGKQINSYRTSFAEAIAANDETMRQLFGGGILQFATCNCAINRNVIGDYYFNEIFLNGEDIEFAARVGRKFTWEYIDTMKIFHSTRDTARGYVKQTYLYGKWKLFFSYKNKTYRFVDFVPLLLIIFAALAAFYIHPWAALVAFLLPTLQTLATITLRRPALKLTPLIALGWTIKDFSWSIGIIIGLVQLLVKPNFRTELRKKDTDE